MKRFSKILIILIITSLIGSIQSVGADHTTALIGYDDKEYMIYLQTVIRDKNDQLVSIRESTTTQILPTYLPNGVPVQQLINAMIDRELMKNYQTVIVDDEKYEKVQWTVDIPADPFLAQGFETPAKPILDLCIDLEGYGYTCVPAFEARTAQAFLAEGDVITDQWTVLRIIS